MNNQSKPRQRRDRKAAATLARIKVKAVALQATLTEGTLMPCDDCFLVALLDEIEGAD